jgi:enoyl-CoA hydratase
MDFDYSKFDQLDVRLEDGILRATLNKPEKLNIIDDDVNTQLGDVFQAAAFDPQVKVLMLAANGRAFSAGGDMVKMQTKIDDPRIFYRGVANSRRLVFAALDCPKPTIAKIHGDAIGLGATLALNVRPGGGRQRGQDPRPARQCRPGGRRRRRPDLAADDRLTPAPSAICCWAIPSTGKEAAEMGLIAASGTPEEVEEIAEKYGPSAGPQRPAIRLRHQDHHERTAGGSSLMLLLDVGMAYEGLSNISRDHQKRSPPSARSAARTSHGD